MLRTASRATSSAALVVGAAVSASTSSTHAPTTHCGWFGGKPKLTNTLPAPEGNHWSGKYIKRTIIPQAEMPKLVNSVADRISAHYVANPGAPLVVICLLNGAFMFYADVTRALTVDHECEFMVASSYGDGTVSSGNVKIKKDCTQSVEGKRVLVVDDICDTGTTMASLVALLRERGATDVKTCVFVNKTPRREAGYEPDWSALTLKEDTFVVGYGMDYAQQFRSLPFVGELKEAVYQD